MSALPFHSKSPPARPTFPNSSEGILFSRTGYFTHNPCATHAGETPALPFIRVLSCPFDSVALRPCQQASPI
jgi:hypothetical protein